MASWCHNGEDKRPRQSLRTILQRLHSSSLANMTALSASSFKLNKSSSWSFLDCVELRRRPLAGPKPRHDAEQDGDEDERVALADPEQHGRLVGLLLYTSSTPSPTAADLVQQPLETDNSSPGSSGGGGGSGQPLDAEAASARSSARFLLYLALVFAVAMRDSDWAASLGGWLSYSSLVAE